MPRFGFSYSQAALGTTLLLIAAWFPGFAFAEGLTEQYVPAEKPIDIIADDYDTAVVIKIYSEVRDDFAGFDHITQKVRMRIDNGARRGEEFDMDNGILKGQEDARFHVGQRLVVERLAQSDGQVRHLVRDPYRIPAMLWLAAFFILLSLLFGGVRGITAVLGLGVSVLILLKYVVPAIASGKDPLFVSVTGSYAIAVTALYLAHGFNKRTSVALLSTCITLAFAAFAAVFSVHFAQLFGFGSEESMYLATGQGGINLQGLLIGGFIIGALGVLDDVTTAQSAAVDEISKANPLLTRMQLWRAGMSVGREHIASLINTLALAYVGASLPLFLLFHQNQDMPTWLVVNGEFIAEEIVRTLVGSLALLLAVPISTWCAAYFLRNTTGHVLSDGAHGHHHHH